MKEWAKTFLKARDVFEQGIVSFEDVGDNFIVNKKSGKVYVFVCNEFMDVLGVTSRAEPVDLVLLNTKKNLDAIISQWDALSSKEHLRIFFVNPKANCHWVLRPFAHNKVIERKDLRLGLESLFAGCVACD